MTESLLKFNKIILGLIFSFFAMTSIAQNFKTIQFPSLDGIEITADVYEIEDQSKPIILLFHQARFSRGEYRETALKLNGMGYSCMAIDQRSGDAVNGVKNQTHQKAAAEGLPTAHTDAAQDLGAAIAYTKDKFQGRKLIVVGSSYSASLALVLGHKYEEDLAGIMVFSPGEYFKYEGNTVASYASKLNCPVFITSSKSEGPEWAEMFAVIPSKNKQSFLPNIEGQHGSKALWKEHEGHEQYWEAVIKFLASL